MAIYHLHAKMLSRANGRNAVESAAYRHACSLFDETLGETFDYSRKKDVIHSEMIIPPLASGWLIALAEMNTQDHTAASEWLWNCVEQSEKRQDAQVAREIEFSLPVELTAQQNTTLAREFITDQLVKRGMIADWSIHWDDGNPHVHVMLTTRELTAHGFGHKVREWNSKALLSNWREKWAEYANFHLRLNGHEVRIDHRSYIEQGIDLVPMFHLGRGAIEIHKQGYASERVSEAKQVAYENLTRIADNPDVLFKKITAQTDTFTPHHVGTALGMYADGLDNMQRAPWVESAAAALAEEASAHPPCLSAEQEANIFSNIEYHESVFTERDIARALNIEPSIPADLFTRALLQIKTSPVLIPLGAGDDGRDRYTTKRLFDLENRLQTLADNAAARRHTKISQRCFNKAIERYQEKLGKTLTDEQRQAVQHITSSPALTCLVGRAGTGKSFSLGAANQVWVDKGCTVRGVALSGIAAAGLENDAGISSRTIESFRYAIAHGQLALASTDVIVMDEAGMTDIESMAFVMEALTQANAKLVLVGDPHQLQPVGPGAVFRALLERIGFVEIQTVYRQQVAWQVEATRLLAQGDVTAALELYQQNGCVFLEKTDEEAIHRLTQDWLNAAITPEHMAGLLVLAHRNTDVEWLNQSIRNARIERGDIEQGYWVESGKGRIQISVGERLLFLKNDKRMGVSNGHFGTITHIACLNGQVGSIHVQCDGMDHPIVLDPAEYDSFTHGYAATVHKSQGVTVDKTFIFAGGRGWNRCLSYVAHTRHRWECRLYASRNNVENEEVLFKTLGRAALKDSVLDFPLAFSARRGFDNAKGLKALPQRLHQSLKTAHDKITSRCEQFFMPKIWAQKQHAKLHEHEKALQDAARREDARLVAAYVDASRAVGETYGNEKERIVSNNMRDLLQQRNALAFDIVKEPARYAKAIDICGLDLKKLSAQAKRHHGDETVKRYLACLASKPLSRNHIAATIYADIKGHYPSLKQWDVDLRALKTHALAYHQRALLKSLSKTERADFRTVNTYYHLNIAIGSAWARALFSTADNMQRRVDVLTQHQMASERDKLAHFILENPPRFDKSLDFFQIGLEAPRFMGDAPHPNAAQKAQQRWFKLQQYAGTHRLRHRVAQYIDAMLQKNYGKQKQLAFEIVNENKAHHPLLLEHNIPIKDFWRTLRRDANVYARDQLLKTVSPEHHSAFLLVEKYSKANRAHKQAWRELFESKALQGSDVALNNLAGFAQPYTQQRNQLASQVLDNVKMCERWFEHFNIKPDELHPAATAHQAVIAVERYHRATTPWERAVCAATLTDNPKDHYKAVRELNLDWKTIYRHATPFKQNSLFEHFSQEEKQLHRFIQHYQTINRHAGRLMGQKDVSSLRYAPIACALQNRLKGLFAKRDALAAQIIEKISALSEESVAAIIQVTRLKKDKCQTHANAHHARLHLLTTWQACFNEVLSTMRPIQHTLVEHQLLDASCVQSAVNALHRAQQLQKQSYFDTSSLHWKNALAECHLTPCQLQSQCSSLAVLKDNLEQALRLQKQRLPEPHMQQLSPVTTPLHTPFHTFDAEKIRHDLKARALEVAYHYLGTPKKRTGNRLSYGQHQGSLVVTVSGPKQGHWIDFDNSVPKGGDMLSLIQHSLHGSYKDALEEAARFLGGTSCYLKNPFEPSSPYKPISKPIVDDKEKQTQQHIASILKGCTDISGTVAERYLQEHRGITLDANLHRPSFRFHPNLKHWLNGQTYPALVVLARDENNRVCGLQAIFLNPHTAQKASLHGNAKLSRGRIQPGALIQQGTQEGKIAFAEGVETALSVANACPDWRIYVTFGISNFAKTPLQTQASSIVLCADNDGENSGTAKGVERATTALSEQGIDVWIAQPQKPTGVDKWDFNDALKAGGVAQVKHDLERAVLIQKGSQLETIQQTLNDTLFHFKEPLSSAIHESGVNEDKTPAPIVPLSELLIHYGALEKEQSRLVTHMIGEPDPLLRDTWQSTIRAHQKSLNDVVNQLLSHAEIQRMDLSPSGALSKAPTENVLQMLDRFKKQDWILSASDRQWLALHLRQKKASLKRALSHKAQLSQGRGKHQ